ncbi:MAG: tetratricopeptide repeat protein [bacterium]|nr:tetratricopeptide repeat protein [bacterium]
MPRIVPTLAAVFCLGTVSLLPAQNERLPETFQVALGLQQRGMHEEAARHFQDFLGQNPRHALRAEAHYRAGVSQAELKQAEPAIRSLQDALKRGGKKFRLRPECQYRLGNLLQAAKRYEPAAAQFHGLVSEAGDEHYLRAAAAFAEGECQRELGADRPAAIAFATSADAAVGEQANFRFPALYQLGFSLRRADAASDAASVFAQAAEEAPDAAAKGECRYLEGDTLLRLERYEDAAQAFRRALRERSEFRDDAQFGLGWVALGKGDQAAARAAFGKVVSDHADSPLVAKARLELGRSCYRDEDYEGAERALKPLQGRGVDAAVAREARELLGLCALASGAGEQAVATLERSLADAAPRDKPRLSFALGEAYANLSEWQKAAAAYAKVPADAEAELRGDALYGRCFALHMLGDHEASNADARAVIALRPAHRLVPHARFAIAENLFAAQRHADAEKEYGRLVDDAEFATKARWKLAWCRYLGGQKKDAARRFGELAGSDAGFAEEALAMAALAQLEAGDGETALATADRYRARYRDGQFLDRTERVAARVLRQRGDLTGARKRLERAASVTQGRQGDATGDRLEQAELAYEQGDYEAADELFAALTAQQSGIGARALAGRAWCAFELGNDEQCARWLSAGLAHAAAAGEAPGLLELQSALAHRSENWAQAITVARQFLKSFGDHAKAPAMRYALGVAESRAGEHAAAQRTLAQLEQQGGYERMDRVLYELAWAARRGGNEAAALAAFQRLVKASSDEELLGEARLHLGVAALERKDFAAADGLLVAVRGTSRARALYRLGFAEFERAGDDRKLLATARDRFAAIAAMTGDPLVPEALYLGAECSQRLGDPRGAVEKAQALLAMNAGHERADRCRLVLGECAVELADGDLAVPALERFLRDSQQVPNGRAKTEQARARLALGRARFLRGEHDRAEQSYERATRLSEGPLGAEAQFRIGEARQAAGNLQGAVDAFVKLPILYAHEEWVRRGLLGAATVYEQMRQPGKAKRLFEELVSKYPDSAEGKAARARLQKD